MSFEFPLPRRRTVMRSFVRVGIACLLATTVNAALTTSVTRKPVAAVDHVHDFDMFFGSWHSRQLRLQARLVGNKNWQEFQGTQVVQPILGGQGNMTENIFTLPDGVTRRGVTIRAFDTKSQKWSIWWLDGSDPTKMDVPVVGSFENGVGTFYANDTYDGKPIKVRFTWLNITPSKLQWEQAYSTDDGKTWETNWIAYFSKDP